MEVGGNQTYGSLYHVVPYIPADSGVFPGGTVLHPVPGRGHPVRAGPEGSGAGRKAEAAAGGPPGGGLSQVPASVQPQ